MASIATRGNSHRVKIFDKGRLVGSKSFTDLAAAKAWGEAEDEKVAFRCKHGDFVLHPSGAGTTLGGFSKPTRIRRDEATRYLANNTPQNAKRALAAFLDGQRTVPTVETVAPPAGPTFHDALVRYQKEESPNKGGFAQEISVINMLKRHKLAVKQVKALTTDDFVAWATGRLKSVSGDTVNRQLNLIHRILEVAFKKWKYAAPVDDNGNSFNPAKIERPPSSEHRDFRLSPEERECFMRHAAADTRGEEVVIVVDLCNEINFRRGELFRMKRSAIDWLAKRLTLAAGTVKNRKPREVPLTTRAIAILRRAVEVIPADFQGRVFPFNGRALGSRFARIRNRAAKEMPNIANFRFHDTRHESLSRMALKIPNVVLLVKASGHKDTKMLMRYVNPAASELAEGHRRKASHLSADWSRGERLNRC